MLRAFPHAVGAGLYALQEMPFRSIPFFSCNIPSQPFSPFAGMHSLISSSPPASLQYLNDRAIGVYPGDQRRRYTPRRPERRSYERDGGTNTPPTFLSHRDRAHLLLRVPRESPVWIRDLGTPAHPVRVFLLSRTATSTATLVRLFSRNGA